MIRKVMHTLRPKHSHLASTATVSARRGAQKQTSFVFYILTALALILCIQTAFAASAGKTHIIELWAEKIPAGVEGGNDLFAYRMARHIIKKGNKETDVTSRYVSEPTIPGPTLVIDEGDEVVLTLKHVFDPGNSATLEQVSVHVHGVHYDIHSDGTLEYINLVADESATPTMSYTYHWVAAPGTAGTWPYHDHNMITLNGAEDRGLYGAVIVNGRTSMQALNKTGKLKNVPVSSIKKEYVLFIGDDAFWGTEIDNKTGQQTPLWHNPTLSAHQGNNVRFHLIALGSNSHNFKMNHYGWIDPGTNLIITEKVIGPLEKHVFAVQAAWDSQYKDDTFPGNSLGMQGNFNVNP
ncbi:multicopper oxidase domain-containing protein [Nitrosomonas marina]|uniref:Multicopper oxidase n=1 Tax=Nitrosomonas marina TaxID=917 RepID=A0A1H8F8J5_9PROT|nr:multicopper oxidase domain-containing protein [Nitrosomonas marina]SEN28251.1 Multicopper oxidase [Nitrosomonas marina]